MIANSSKKLVERLTAYAKQEDGKAEQKLAVEMPEDLAALSDGELQELIDEATAQFDALYDSDNLTDEQYADLATLTEQIEALQEEQTARQEAAALRAQKADKLAAKIGRDKATLAEEAVEELSSDDDSEQTEELAAENEAEDTEQFAQTEEAEEQSEAEVTDEEEMEAVTASSKGRSIPLANVRGRNTETAGAAAERQEERTIRDFLIASGDGLGQPVGTGIDFNEAADMMEKRLNAFPEKSYRDAQKAGRQLSARHPLINIKRHIPENLQVTHSDPSHVDEVMDRATNERELVGGSLVAAGGWCAPSETLYELGDEFESRDGLLSLPEIGVARGGVNLTTGVDFADLFSQVSTGAFSFTEEQDEAGEYAPNETPGGANVVGDKPCFVVDCPDFTEYRLDVDGLCVTAGILQSRGYPEVQARTLRGVLVAHDHVINGKVIAQMAAGSTAVTLPTTQAGTAAPLLTAIELQAEHYRASRRMSMTSTLEAVFPFWVRGAIRADLARRLGVDLIAVSNARINGWFGDLGIAPQFVYNWQAIDTTAAASFTAYPTTVKFMLYAAGTWVKGINDIITMDNIYDSTLLGQNNFVALFTEEGWFVAKRGQDSRVVEVPITADGATHIGIDIAHNGTVAPAAAVPGATADAPLFTSDVTAG